MDCSAPYPRGRSGWIQTDFSTSKYRALAWAAPWAAPSVPLRAGSPRLLSGFSPAPGSSPLLQPQQAEPPSWFSGNTRAFQRPPDCSPHGYPFCFISLPVHWGSWPPTLLPGDTAPDLSLLSRAILIVIQTPWNISCQHLCLLIISSCCMAISLSCLPSISVSALG